MDHDQRFKNLIQAFFREFLMLFFGTWAERLDCAAVEWLEQEIFPDPPEGRQLSSRWILSEEATRIGGSPGRRGPSLNGTFLPVTSSTTRMISRTL